MELEKKDPLFPPFTFESTSVTTNNSPEYPKDVDYTTNAQSYYDKLAKDNNVLKLLATRIWEYDKTLDTSLKHIQEVLQNYSNILDGKLKNFDETVFRLVNEWINENLERIFTDVAKIVWFGLNDDGHFIAVIPQNWSDIDFDTSENGNLVLKY